MVKRKERKESDQAQAATSRRAENSPEALVVGRQSDSKADKNNPKIKLNPGTASEEILGPNSTKSNKPR